MSSEYNVILFGSFLLCFLLSVTLATSSRLHIRRIRPLGRESRLVASFFYLPYFKKVVADAFDFSGVNRSMIMYVDATDFIDMTYMN